MCRRLEAVGTDTPQPEINSLVAELYELKTDFQLLTDGATMFLRETEYDAIAYAIRSFSERAERVREKSTSFGIASLMVREEMMVL